VQSGSIDLISVNENILSLLIAGTRTEIAFSDKIYLVVACRIWRINGNLIDILSLSKQNTESEE
jgi:hypothetical protein